MSRDRWLSRQGRLLAVRGWGPGVLPASQCPRPAARERPGPSVRRAEGETLAPGGSPRSLGLGVGSFALLAGVHQEPSRQGLAAMVGLHPGAAVGAVDILSILVASSPREVTLEPQWWGSPRGRGRGGHRGRAGGPAAAPVDSGPAFLPATVPGSGGRCAPGPRGGGRAPGLPARAQGAPPLQARGTPCSTRRRARRTRTC